MNLKEFYAAIKGGDELPVLLVVEGDAYEVHNVEEGNNDAGEPELWVVAGERIEL